MSTKQEKKLSKRQAMRLERQRKERQRRLVTILAVVAVSAVLVFLLVIPTIQQLTAPVGEIVEITPKAYPDSVDGLAIGNPNAPVKIEIFEDFQCSACVSFTEYIEPQVIAELVETGQAYYVFRHFPFLDGAKQLHLNIRCDLGDLVEEQRASL